ncbi:MAG: hypothetical protein B6I37_07580 [Desulfobacteraceae bacterium 4572_35.2]|nr:MAG: hypothetical protein B6I37_07580 [Desulfobacteraceae bacterium 4572_35.2]
MSLTRLPSFVFIALLCAVSLCVLPSCIKQPSQPPVSVIDNTQMLQWLQARQYRHHSLCALAQVKMTQNGKSWSTTQALLVATPNRLRIDMINFFGQLLVQLSVDGPQLNAYVPRDKTHYFGMPTLDNIKRFTGLPLPITDLVALLLGKMPLGVLETAQVTAWEKGLIFSTAAGVDYRVEFDGKRVVDLLYSVNNYTVYHVKYGPYVGDNNYPQQLILQAPMNDVGVVVKFDELELNSTLSKQQFKLVLPENTLSRSLSQSEETL